MKTDYEKDSFLNQLLMETEIKYKTTVFQAKENVWNKVEESIAEDKKRHSNYWTRYITIAATLVLISIGGFLLCNMTKKIEQQLVLIANTTPANMEYTLSDGTEIILRPNAQLSYIQDSYARDITFVGEAYFKVAKNKKRPFIIQTDMGNITVYGTEFNLQSMQNAENLELVLVEGSVGFKPINQSGEFKIAPNNMLTVNKEDCSVNICPVKVEHYTAWTNGYYIFENEPFKSIANRLSELYGITIIIGNDQLNNLPLTGKLKLSNSIESVFKSINHFTTINFRKEGNTYFVY